MSSFRSKSAQKAVEINQINKICAGHVLEMKKQIDNGPIFRVPQVVRRMSSLLNFVG